MITLSVVLNRISLFISLTLFLFSPSHHSVWTSSLSNYKQLMKHTSLALSVHSSAALDIIFWCCWWMKKQSQAFLLVQKKHTKCCWITQKQWYAYLFHTISLSLQMLLFPCIDRKISLKTFRNHINSLLFSMVNNIQYVYACYSCNAHTRNEKQSDE